MQELQSEITLDSILRRDAAQIRAWVNDVRMHVVEPAREFNWLGLAEVTGSNARRHAAWVERPISRFPKEMQEILRTAVCRERADLEGDEPQLRQWLESALPAIAWADAAVAAYSYLASVSSGREKESYQDSVMNLRAFMISRLGSIPGDRILDAADIVYWFFDIVDTTPQKAMKKSLFWRESLPHNTQSRQVTEIRRLRRIKNRLAPIAVLTESGQLEPTPALREWLALRGQLP